MTFPVYIFDWDGTLVDSERHIVESLEFAASQLKLNILSYDRYKDIIGLGMVEALETLYPGLSVADIDRMRAMYAQYFFKESMTSKNLFAGVENTLTTLKNKGIKLAVATGKSRNGLDKALDSTGLKAYFEITRCADETKSKPNPLMLNEILEYFSVSSKDAVMVGDTEYDLEMASRADMASIGVSYGVHDVSRLEKYKPMQIIDNFADILN